MQLYPVVISHFWTRDTLYKFRMQNKKKFGGRISGQLASPKVSRLQKKVSENAHIQAKKVTELITSSARKQKTGSFLF